MLALSQGQSHALGLDAGEVVGLDWVLQGKNFPTFFLNFKFILVIFFFFWSGPQATPNSRQTAVSPAVITLIQGCTMVSCQPQRVAGIQACTTSPAPSQLSHRRRGVCSPKGKEVFGGPSWLLLVFQNLKQQYYTGYMESEVLEIMQHMAKNVVKVNENLTKFIVSAEILNSGNIRFWAVCGSVTSDHDALIA